MQLCICAIRDEKTGAFMRPFFMLSSGQALRSFQDEVNRNEKDNLVFFHPDDFSLFQVGTFDDADGGIAVTVPPKLLATGTQLKLA